MLKTFFETFPECSQPSIVLKNTIKKIGRHDRKRDMKGQFIPNHVGCFIGSCYTLR